MLRLIIPFSLLLLVSGCAVDATMVSPVDANDDTDETRPDAGSAGNPDAGTDSECAWARVVGVGNEALFVREQPNTAAAVVGQLRAGAVVPVIGSSEGDTVTDAVRGSSSLWYQSETGWFTAVYAECTEEPDVAAWAWPVPANPNIGQDYGNPISYQSCGYHTGLDIGGASGSSIVAAGSGTVVHVGPMWFAGDGQGRGPYAIIIDHGNLLYSTYGHNRASLVEVGDQVTAGDPIAEMGSLGYSSGPHLHFEMVEGQTFTNNWQVPFQNACQAYRDPKNYVPR